MIRRRRGKLMPGQDNRELPARLSKNSIQGIIMKRVRFAVVLACVWAASVFSICAQGTLRFANDENSLVTSMGVPVTSGFVQLIWAPEGSPVPLYGGALAELLAHYPMWHLVEGVKIPIGPSPGRFDGGVLTIPTTSPGAIIDVAVIAWQGNYTSVDEAFQNYSPAGSSGKAWIDTGNPNAQPQPEPPGQWSYPGGFDLPAVIPEPSSSLLAVVFGAAVALRRLRRVRGTES
jgi:hypothetical protein